MNTGLFLHAFFQSLGILVGMYLYKKSIIGYPKNEIKNKFLSAIDTQLYLLILIVSSVIGAHLPSIFINYPSLNNKNILNWFTDSGITITGALCGAWLGSELYRFFLGKKISTGNEMVISLCIGISIGRIGCFLMGLGESTYGIETNLPWGYDFGDGIKRHPTQIYDIIFLFGFAGIYYNLKEKLNFGRGEGFNLFLSGYLGWRFFVDFLKPDFNNSYYVIGIHITFIQIICFIFCLLSFLVLIYKIKRTSHV